MAFGFGGFGGGHGGGAGGPGGHGGPGPGGHGPGFGGPGGPGIHGGRGRGGGFFGFGHFGFNSSGSAHGNNNTNPRDLIVDDCYPFPDNFLVQDLTPPTTVQERINLSLINLHSIERAVFWHDLLSIILTALAILSALFISDIRLSKIVPILILSPLITLIRTLLLERYGRILTDRLSVIISLILIITAVIHWLITSSSPRIIFAYSLTFIISSLVYNYAFRLARTSQALRGFDDDRRTFRRRLIGASSTARLFGLLVFVPCAFAGTQVAFLSFRLSVCFLCLCPLADFILSPITYTIRNQFTYHLSADFDILVDA